MTLIVLIEINRLFVKLEGRISKLRAQGESNSHKLDKLLGQTHGRRLIAALYGADLGDAHAPGCVGFSEM